MNRLAGFASILLLASLFRSGAAFAAVTREGAWPDAEKPISLDASGLSRSEAVKRIADAAGWNVVVHAPSGDPIDIHVKNQPAGKVLDLVLNDASYVAHRDGTLIDIQRAPASPAAAAAPEAPPAPVAPPPAIAIAPAPPAPPALPIVEPPSPMPPPIAAPAATARGEDRVVTGGSLRIEKNETVNDVTVYGGSVDVFGTVTGDMVVTGGSARIHEGGHVEGDATTVGGSLNVEDGATVDGDVGVVGGVLKRAEGAKIGGKVVTGSKDDDDDDDKVHLKINHGNVGISTTNDQIGSRIGRWTRDAGGAVTRTAMLFVFGAVLLALGARRMDSLRAEIAVRPMRSFALGIVGGVAGIVAVALLCVTVIGIPVAVVGLLCAVFGVYAGMCAALTTAGEALTAHRTKNPYAHLAVGCALFLMVGAIPVIGGVMHAIVAFIGIGVLVATRGAGLIKPRTPGQGPYRTADSI
ncbi:MAG: hypothetical protein ABIP39_08050 [Polyangiaceae bacterium]